jgi:GH24 family phage-related lysozyme (muramidase)
MQYSDKARQLVKQFEGCRLTAYLDDNGLWTIGYGRKLGLQPTYSQISQELANQWLDADLTTTSRLLTAALQGRFVPTQNQFDALVSFCFNEGCGQFAKSNMLQRLWANDTIGALQEFGRWIRVGGHVDNGLIERRAKEAELFNITC